MADTISKSDDPSKKGRERQIPSQAARPFLRMRPRHFFSNKFDMEIVEDISEAEAADEQERSVNRLGRLMDLNLLLLIILVGVPVLFYCIFSSAT